MTIAFPTYPLSPETTIQLLLAGWHLTFGLMQQLFNFAAFFFFAFFLTPFGKALTAQKPNRKERALRLGIFLIGAAFVDPIGQIFSVSTGQLVPKNQFFQMVEAGQGILSLRDIYALIAGFAGGYGVGLLIGLVSALVRFSLGGDFGLASSVAVIVIGLYGAYLRDKLPRLPYSPVLAMAAGLGATLLLKLVMAIGILPDHDARYIAQISVLTLVPKLVSNVSGCLLFSLVLRLIERRRKEVQEQKEAQWEAMTDRLTELPNRTALDERLKEEIMKAHLNPAPLCLLIVDADHFKQVNDEHGHGAGDKVLKTLGKLLRESARESDFVARWGGEEFIVLLPNTDLAGATLLADRRIREAIAHATWPDNIGVTVSIGMAQLQDANGLIKQADDALYRAKQGGRNQVSR